MFTLIIAPLLENVTPPGAFNRSNTVFISYLTFIQLSKRLKVIEFDLMIHTSQVIILL